MQSGRRLCLTAISAGAVACVFAAAGFQLCAQAKSAPAASSTRTMLVEPPAPLLPATLAGLHREADGDAGDGLGKLDAAGLSAQDKSVLAEDGLKRFAQSNYSQGAEHGTVTVFRFMDVSGAIATFDYLRRPGAAKIGDQAAPGPDGDLVFRSGINIVRETFNLHGDHVAVLMSELIEHLPKVGGPAGMAPLLPTLVPAKGFDTQTVKYALGPAGYAATGGVLPANVVGFDKSAEAVTVKAKSGGMLTLVLYPTPQIAGAHLQMIQSAMNQQGAAVGTVVLRRDGPLVAMASGAWSAQAAQAMLAGIHLRTEVSFDKPMPLEFHAEVKKTYGLLTSIAIFCGIAFLAAIVLALFLGGGRAALRVLQGKPAASEPEFLRINLRGQEKEQPGDQ
ncbi:MAG TPA: DUF6599 family protein [Acidobacteriaceae bacterium]|nr:DUF6599 family protein [Acidobacteriaceae bacterium]